MSSLYYISTLDIRHWLPVKENASGYTVMTGTRFVIRRSIHMFRFGGSHRPTTDPGTLSVFAKYSR